MVNYVLQINDVKLITCDAQLYQPHNYLLNLLQSHRILPNCKTKFIVFYVVKFVVLCVLLLNVLSHRQGFILSGGHNVRKCSLKKYLRLMWEGICKSSPKLPICEKYTANPLFTFTLYLSLLARLKLLRSITLYFVFSHNC